MIGEGPVLLELRDRGERHRNIEQAKSSTIMPCRLRRFSSSLRTSSLAAQPSHPLTLSPSLRTASDAVAESMEAGMTEEPPVANDESERTEERHPPPSSLDREEVVRAAANGSAEQQPGGGEGIGPPSRSSGPSSPSPLRRVRPFVPPAAPSSPCCRH